MFIRYFKYSTLIKNTKCLIGNSSSSIRDGAFIGVPAVNVGKRQNNRLRSKNVIQSSNETADIYKKIKIQYGKKFKPSKENSLVAKKRPNSKTCTKQEP